MKVVRVRVRNFKGISDAELSLGSFTAIFGENGSGKSSILQAIHWIVQSGRSPKVDPRAPGYKSTLSERDAIYMPTPDYANASNAMRYGNKDGSPELIVDITCEFRDEEDVAVEHAEMSLKAARNAGLSIHVPAANRVVKQIRSDREFSAYIPGLAGVPLAEVASSPAIVHTRAASGDANTVFRNVLLLLQSRQDGSMETLIEDVRAVFDGFQLEVSFNPETDSHITANFKTAGLAYWKPIELAGVGFLQVLQIFAYLHYFRPVLLLVDEPDAHLHPPAQERLVRALSRAAADLGTQVLVTSHSATIMRSLPVDSQIVWMTGGRVQANPINTRRRMGWGLQDKKKLLITEDKDVGPLKTLLSQWPDLERVVAIWPVSGVTSLPRPVALEALKALFPDDLGLIVHRDRDFLVDDEVQAFRDTYTEVTCDAWVTDNSDIEAYWVDPTVVSAHFGVSMDEATQALEDIAGRFDRDLCRREIDRKAEEARKTIQGQRSSPLPQPGSEARFAQAVAGGPWHAKKGKDVLAEIRSAAAAASWQNFNTFGKVVPGSGPTLASSLRDILRR